MVCANSSLPTGPLPARVKDLTGRQFGRLTVQAFAGLNLRKGAIWRCVCLCGTITDVEARHLGKSTLSCGCLLRERQRAAVTRHGGRKTAAYSAWANMRRRCLSPRYANYHCYGGRGITICTRWRGPDGFKNFLADMGPPPAGTTLDRRNVNGPYSPGNCRWATTEEQAANKQNTRLLTYAGETLCQAAWARRLGISVQSLVWRLTNWPLARVFTMRKTNGAK